MNEFMFMFIFTVVIELDEQLAIERTWMGISLDM
jgi:hypothetical protein